MSERLSSSTSQEQDKDNGALREAYAQTYTEQLEAENNSTTPRQEGIAAANGIELNGESSATPEIGPETGEQVKKLEQRIKELEAALSETRDMLANLQAGPGKEVPTPITVEAIAAPGSDRRDFLPATEPRESGYADYTDTHTEKMSALTERGREAIDRKHQAEARRERRREVRRYEKEARKAEGQDRRHELRDKAATKLRGWGRAALRSVGRGLRATGRAIKGAATGAREAVRNG